jgi:hypothetical protein
MTDVTAYFAGILDNIDVNVSPHIPLKRGATMNVEDQHSTTNDITCIDCGKTTGEVKIGTSWICEDCKVSEKLQPSE